MGENYYNLTAPQKSIWLTEQYYKNTNINNVCGTFYSNECLNFETLKKALNIFLQNNDSFKIKLHFTEDKISQYFSELNNIDFPIVDIKTKEEQTALEEKIASKVFSMLDSLLFEIVLFRYPDNHGGFVINSHHIISDSWTNGIVANDVALIYAKIKSNESYQKDENLSYKNYIISEENYIKSDKFQKDKKYWNDLFATIPEVATIPSIKDTKKDEYLSAKRLLLDLNKETFGAIKSYCDKNKVSFYNFFMTIFSLYLGRVSNLDEFVIGTPILNRTNFKEKQTTGMFINTLPLKITLSHEKTFLENLKDIAVNSMSLLRHQKYSYQYLIEDLRKRDSNLPMLYKVVFSYQVTKMNENMDALNHTTSWTFNNTIADDLDIHMFEWNENNSIQIAYDYRTNKYDEQDIADLHARILHVINQILDNENVLLKDIEIVTPEEKHKILYEFNNTKVDYPKDKTIVDLFEEQVEKTPDNIAVVFEDQQLTYKELNEKANQLAKHMITNGIKSNSIIGLMLNRSLEMIVGILSILKCGCTYLPLDPSFPKERLEYMLNDSNISLVLLSNSTFKEIDSKYPKLNISFSETIYNNSTNNIKLRISPHSFAYLIYTSGSTGNPKGVMVSHKNLNNFLIGLNEIIDFSESKTILSVTTVSFDIFGLELFAALTNGLKLVLANEKEQNSAEAINKLCIVHNIQMIQTTPSRFNDFLMDKEHLYFFSNLTDIMIGGEPLTNSLIKKLRLITSANIYNMYGPTETTIWSTIKKIDTIDSVSIGFPISNTQCYILDGNKNILPPFTPGNLYIGGDGVSSGYLNRPELTNTVFTNSPFSKDAIIYNTKDLAYYNKNGELFHLGRSDSQIKLRGYRVELGEIENKILSFGGISQAVVTSIENKYLILYYSCENDIDINSLKSFLSECLPTYMIPSLFKRVIQFPYTPNGKIDRKKLSLIKSNASTKKIEPRNDIDKFLLKLLSNMLNVNNISIDDTFFAIGGDSLSAINISSRISTEYNIQLSVKDILEHPVLTDLSDYISTLSNNINKNIISKAENMKYYPMSSAQKRIYYSSSLENNSTLYNIAGGIIIDKLLDINKLQECFNTLINRHEALRTHFDIINNEVVQIIDDNIDFELSLKNATSDDLNKTYSDFVKPFDLSKAPLFRSKLIKLKNDKMLLLLDMHHIISDGTSLSILLEELCDLYNGLSLPEKHIDYKDFTLWEKEQFETDEFNKSKEYWINQFNDEIPLLNMPTTSPRPSVQCFDGSNYHTSLSEDIFDKVNKVSKELNITPYMLMLSAYYILLSKYTSQDDIVIGTPIIGRELPELSNIIGMFVNTLALRNKIDHNLSFEEFSRSIKENCLNSFKNQSYPFDMLVKDLNIKRDTSRNSLFDVMFVYQNNGYPKINFKDAGVEYFIPDNNIAKFDLTLEVIPTDNEYSLRFEYCTKLFNEDFIKRLSSHYINILNAILENNKIKIANIDMLSREEKNQILYEFNNTNVDYPKDKTIIDLFEEQVEKTPDNIAVVFENQKLTYRELNEKANQLARILLANNVAVADIVCILLDKSLEMIVSILSILKVGATFLPIDINYPKERIDYIINNSNSNILLTTQNFINKANDTVQVLNVELDNMQYYQYSKENINIKYSFDNLAYVMYTSGSTGNPKGVMVTHKNVLRLVINNKFITFSENEHILQTGSIVFDACTFEIWGALLNGFELYIIKKEKLLDATYLKKYMKDNKITSLFITTQLFNQLVDSDIEIFSSISNVLTGGEAVSVKHINKLNLYNKNINIIHCYGPTENTTFSTCYDVKKIKYINTVPIGGPISNSTAYIVSNSGLLCPIGVPGELWVGGDGVAKGYLNNEDLTNEKFIKNPFGEGIIYKTGDLVKWLADGNIEFIGRIDNQVKVRGFRIELNEIDLKILEYPDIKYSTTILNTINNEKVICSYFVSKADIDLSKLKEFLKTSLPNYMIPTYMLQLEKFEMTINGKIDKKSLPTDFRALKRTKIIKRPCNEIEEKLLQIYKYVTNIDEISVTDNLFDDLHGDSLIAMKIQVEAMSQNINISYSDIFKYPSIRLLANNLIHKEKRYQENDTFSSKEFNKYDEILKKNSLTYPIKICNTPITNLLLTGFTGFLGAHILDSFIKKENGKIYCLIRSKNNMSAKERLLSVLHFYFEDKYDKFVGNRIQVVEGDISFDKFGLSDNDYSKLGRNISTVIHSAALVKHYGMYKDFESANIIGTQNIVDFTTKFNLNLLHISTLSVSGNNFADGSHIEDNFETDIDFAENNFYIGQNVEGLYARSKFEAEHIVLNAIYNLGLKATILRMGNLTSRFSEGKFQQNHFENAFVNRFKSFLQIGYVPDYMLGLYAEFTPIDYCGDAIIEIAKHFNPDYTVLHLMNEKRVYLDRLFDMMRQLNINLKVVPEKEFIQIINDLLADENKRMFIEGIINDFDKNNKHLVYESKVKVKCDFSKAYLEKLGFSWPYIDINYMRNYFKYLENIGYLNINMK